MSDSCSDGMLLLDLPEDLLIVIIRKLDTISLYNVYNSCKRLRSVVCTNSMLTYCCMSHNKLASVNTFNCMFFKDVSRNIVDLNLCGVPDLRRPLVLNAVKMLKQLKVIDISFTTLDILDLIEIYKVCPTLTDVTVNLQFGKYNKIPLDVKLKCQNMFKNFVNVHFVGSLVNLLCSKFIVFILAKSKINHLKYTRAEKTGSFGFNGRSTDTDDEFDIDEGDYDINVCNSDRTEAQLPKIDQFTAYLMNWQYKNTSPILNMRLSEFPVLSIFNLKIHEYVVVSIEEFSTKVYATPMFNKYFSEMFDITVERSKNDMKLSSNMVIMIWSNTKTIFNCIFFKKLSKTLKQYLPYYFPSDSEEKLTMTDYDWFYTIPDEPTEEKPDQNGTRIGNKRIATCNNMVLNYDKVFEDKEKIELTFVFKNILRNPIALTGECDYLRKLTYLSFINIGRYSLDFFNMLFICCINLKTLNVESSSLPPCWSALGRFLPLSASLKNLRLVDKNIDFSSLFEAVKQCRTMQNIHVVDKTTHCTKLGDPIALVQGSQQLHSIYILADMSAALQRRTIQQFRNAKKTFNKPYINVVIKTKSETHADCMYDTFIDVFRLSPIRPLHSK